MIEQLRGLADVFGLIRPLPWLILLAALLAAMIVPRTRILKALAAIVALGLFLAGPVRWAWKIEKKHDAHVALRDKAVAHWQERCKQAGIFIYRTVDNVEGLYIGEIPQNRYDESDQNAPDIFNHDYDGNSYIRSFLTGRDANGKSVIGGSLDPANPHRDADGSLIPVPIIRPGYSWVEGVDPKDGRRYRYTGKFELLTGSSTSVDLVVHRNSPQYPSPRYALERIDLSTPEDRAHWVAGGALRIIDLQTGEVLAERKGFMVDRDQGLTAGFRVPWSVARKDMCPRPIIDDPFQSGGGPYAVQHRLFVERILKIKGDAQ